MLGPKTPSPAAPSHSPRNHTIFESFAATSGGTQRWSQTSTALVENALFYRVFRVSVAIIRESLPLRHNRTASRKPRKIRSYCTPDGSGLALECSPKGGPIYRKFAAHCSPPAQPRADPRNWRSLDQTARDRRDLQTGSWAPMSNGRSGAATSAPARI